MTDTTDARIVELEIRYTQQEHVIDQLSEVLRDQQRQIDRLTRAIEDLQAPQGSEGDAPANDPPPHY